jgi:hypothetical protein
MRWAQPRERRLKLANICGLPKGHEDRTQLSSRLFGRRNLPSHSGLSGQGDASALNHRSTHRKGLCTGSWQQRAGGRRARISRNGRADAPRSRLRSLSSGHDIRRPMRAGKLVISDASFKSLNRGSLVLLVYQPSGSRSPAARRNHSLRSSPSNFSMASS